MTNNNFSQTAAFLWSVADLLRGDFKQSQYGRIILPFTLLRRLECVLADSKEKVLSEYKKVQTMNLPEEMQEKMLLRVTNNLAFFNTSPLDLKKLGQADIKKNLNFYIQSFSKDAREIFNNFKFEEFLTQLEDANLLYQVTQIFANADLSPKAISNHEMGLVFEELIRRFAESSNETAGEHFTPRDIVNLTTALVFAGDDDALSKEGIIRTIYDPTAGTGGFLSSGMEYLHELNPNAVMQTLVEHYDAFFVSQDTLSERATEIRAMIKADFTELKEKDVKDLLDIQTWQDQADLFTKAEALQAVLGTEQSDDFNTFSDAFKKAEKSANVALTTKERKQIMAAITWKNADAEPVVKKALKVPANPLYGACEYLGKVVEFEQDGDLRDNENIPLDPSVTTTELIESYVQKEVLPHVADAWINADKKDAQDEAIGIVGYEIPFNRHFYEYEPPRDLAEIDAELFAVSQEIMKLLEEVHS